MSTGQVERRYRLEYVAIGFVAIAALAMGAAAITTLTPGGAVDGEVESNLDLPSEVPAAGVDLPGGGLPDIGTDGTTGVTFDLAWCSSFLTSSLGGILYFGAFAGVLVLLKRRYSLGVAAFGAYGLSPVVLVAYFVSTDCATGDGSAPTGPPGMPKSPASPGVPFEPSPLLVVGAIGFVLVGALALLYRVTGDQVEADLDPVGPDEEADVGTDVADLAAAAGAAADRLEEHNADVDNEVYRAWWEMTSLLEVSNPHSSTPGEFAEAAIEVGMGERHVDELTRLFEEVRYGGRDPESREERAIEVFRAIEARYT